MAEKKTISVKVFNKAGEEVSKISLNAEVFGIEPNNQVMFDAVQVEQSNTRQATAKTKVRHEVSGGGKNSSPRNLWRKEMSPDYLPLIYRNIFMKIDIFLIF